MKILFALCFAACSSVLLGQSAPLEKPPLPAGPIIDRSPKTSEWTVTYRYGVATDAPDGDSKTASNKFTADPFDYVTSRLAKATVSKANDTIHEQYIYENGKAGEKWLVGKLQIAAPPGGKYTRCYGSSSDRYKSDFSKSDFTGFDWVSAANYQGVLKVSGIECYVFEDERESYEVSDPKDYGEWKACAAPGSEPRTPFPSKQVKCVAYIDQEHRLPVALVIGNEVRHYVFNASPASKLAPEGPAATEFKNWHALLDIYR